MSTHRVCALPESTVMSAKQRDRAQVSVMAAVVNGANGMAVDKSGRIEVTSKQDRSSSQEMSPPPDRWYAAGAIVFLIGVATLLPWNFFITANDFWMYKFRDVNRDSKNSTDAGGLTPLQLTFNSYLTIASSLPLIFFLLVNTAISERIPVNPRIEWSIFLSMIVFGGTIVTALVDTDHYQTQFLAVTLTLVAIINSLAGVLSGGGTGAIGNFPERYMVVKSIGQAVAGIFACVGQIVCLKLDASPSSTAVGYFSLAVVVLALTQAGFWWLKESEFYRYYVRNYDDSATKSQNDCDNYREPTPFLRIFKDGWEHHISIMLTLGVTLLCFPAVAALIRRRGDTAVSADRLFVPIITFLNFNVSDFIGRLLALYLPTSAQWGRGLLIASVGRIAFLPLFLMCNIAPDNRVITAVHLPYEWQYALIMFVFGLSNGYIITVTMALAPKVTAPRYQEVAGSMVVTFDAIGLFIGSMLSIGAVKLL